MFAELDEIAIDGDRAKNIHARLARFRSGTCANIHVHIFDVVRFRWFRAASFQMDGKSGDNAINPFPVRRADLHRLRGVQIVENGRQTRAGKSLQAQVAVVGDSADDKSRLVSRRDNQPVW